MEARQLDRIEQAIDVAAAAVFAAAAAFLAIRFGAGGAVAAGFAAFGLCLGLLRSIKTPAAEFVLPGFDPAAPPPIIRLGELELTDADRLHPAGDGELILEDVLADLSESSRVVRLFDPAAMPSPGELRSRIDRHLDRDSAPPAAADASKALHEALFELRKSLR
jgi:hypothetical protein